MSPQSEVEQLVAQECSCTRAKILEPDARCKILEPAEVRKLNGYRFAEYLEETGTRAFYPIVLYYYGMKRGFPEFSYSSYHLLHISKNAVKQLGLADHLRHWHGKAEKPPTEEELIDLFGKALVEEASARGIFDKVDSML